ncbi:MAG: hypothetical protein M3R06_03225 [Chloroflexota bacterium]|nr:hypothetical protein [Chloroflexota bacterium]
MVWFINAKRANGSGGAPVLSRPARTRGEHVLLFTAPLVQVRIHPTRARGDAYVA